MTDYRMYRRSYYYINEEDDVTEETTIDPKQYSIMGTINWYMRGIDTNTNQKVPTKSYR